ncbi:uncharacterized protein C1orf87 homolog [Pseudorasbora parva]|uniref:uncharacterized protein C1orf87 homolog n=1 Tax=Pseudorasbora parva TaxID=51549 RepID=UPI00351E52C8
MFRACKPNGATPVVQWGKSGLTVESLGLVSTSEVWLFGRKSSMKATSDQTSPDSRWVSQVLPWCMTFDLELTLLAESGCSSPSCIPPTQLFHPTDHPEISNSSEDRNSPPLKDTDGDLSRKPASHDLEPLGPESLLDALRQVPDRRCVTAPCGDRSRSYIHLKSTTNLSSSKQLQIPHITGEETEEPDKSGPECFLFSSVSEELKDWEPQTFQSIEEEVTSLDPSQSGTLHQLELTYLFLRLKIPLKLSTLACVFKSFRNTSDPEQVNYKDLLQFILRAVPEDKQPSVETEIWDASVASTDLESVISVCADKRETWLQRFQKMEMALQMCDTKNTGYVDRDQAKRLILNYSLIFDLNLSPLKVNEITRNTQREGRVHLASALRQLKEL